MGARPFVSLTTDFGAAYTAICAGVVYSVAPDANVLVLSDEVKQYSIREGAMLLRQALPYMPIGTHIAIVDPGVGTPRRPVALATGRGDVLIGPDNGLLLPAAEVLGQVTEARELTNPDLRLPAVSSTFHGRDIFSPAAAHLANGVEMSTLGPAIETDSLVPLEVPKPVIGNGRLTLTVLYVDDFGSLILSGREDDLRTAFGGLNPETKVRITWTGQDERQHRARVPYRETYGAVDPGHALLFRDSSGWLGIAVNQGSASTRFGIGEGATLTLRPVAPRG